MAIVRLALANPAANTNTLLHESIRQSLVSVIATNTASTPATVQIWVQPQGATSASAYAYIAYNTSVPGSNSLETFRFALETQDDLYVRSSSPNISFSLNAIYESSGNQNIVTVSSTAPNAPNIGDVWVNSTTTVVSFWDGSDWVSAVGGSAGYPQPSEPGSPTTGTLWVDTDDIDPNYPSYPTVVYSPTAPSGLSILDVGTIWVDENFPSPLETVVPAVLYQSACPSGLTQNDIGYLWVDSDDNTIEYNMNDYTKSVDMLNPLMLAGM
jgi:hypothetical protein